MMTTISPIVTNTAAKTSAVERGLVKLANTKFVQNLVAQNKNPKNPNFYPQFVLALGIIQNLVGTAIYTVASLKNTGIPEEQRKFAAAMDIMNGVFNFGCIYTIGGYISRNSKKWAEAVAKPLMKQGSVKYQIAINGFSTFMTLIVGVVGVQRIIVPFFSTPAAKWFKEKFMSKDKNTNFTGNKSQENINVTYHGNELEIGTTKVSSQFDPANPFKAFEMFQHSLNKVA